MCTFTEVTSLTEPSSLPAWNCRCSLSAGGFVFVSVEGRKEIKDTRDELDQLSDLELVQLLTREAQALLEDRNGGETDDQESIG